MNRAHAVGWEDVLINMPERETSDDNAEAVRRADGMWIGLRAMRRVGGSTGGVALGASISASRICKACRCQLGSNDVRVISRRPRTAVRTRARATEASSSTYCQENKLSNSLSDRSRVTTYRTAMSLSVSPLWASRRAMARHAPATSRAFLPQRYLPRCIAWSNNNWTRGIRPGWPSLFAREAI